MDLVAIIYHYIMQTLFTLVLAATLVVMVQLALILNIFRRVGLRIDRATDINWWGALIRGWFAGRK